MNRNSESHFAEIPRADIQRSRFDRSCDHVTSFNVGQLIPFFWDEVLPGDTFDVKTSMVVRLQTLLAPIMGNIMCDTYYFFVPNRIIWEHWKNFMGENPSNAWLPSTSYRVPRIVPPEGGWNVGTIADYLGVPPNVDGDLVNPQFNPSALPFRGFAMIYNEWFRDQNHQDPLVIPTGDSTVTGVNTGVVTTDVAKGGKPPLAAKFHDYFTSALPSPLRRGSQVNIFGSNQSVNGYNPMPPGVVSSLNVPVTTGEIREHGTGLTALQGYMTTGGDNPVFYQKKLGSANSPVNDSVTANLSGTSGYGFEPTNLWADLSRVNLTINELRLAFQLQKFYERMARSGMRYREILLGMFNVHSPDQRMMIPEYLGGHRFPLSIHQIANQAASSGENLGDLGAMSNTADVHSDFVKSFTEHGIVIGVLCCRYQHSYPQGLNKAWQRYEMLDYYFPTFANIGETPIHKSEIFWDASSNANVWGYQEAWADYRYGSSMNRVSGEMRPGIANSLASWHLADYYTEEPTLSAEWIGEDKANVDRVLAVTSLSLIHI